MSGLDEARIAAMSGPARRALRDALVAAYPSRGRLEELLDGLDKPLAHYAAENVSLPDAVFKVVDGARAEGWLPHLLAEAAAVNPGNSQLAEVVSQYRRAAPGADPGQRPGGDLSTAASGEADDPPSVSAPPTSGIAVGVNYGQVTGQHVGDQQAPATDTSGDTRVGDDGWDFFVSYTQADVAWAEWIAWTLEKDGYRVLVQAWDMPGGSNWVVGMQNGVHRAARTVAVLSAAYGRSMYGAAEWQAAWARDPDGAGRKLLVFRIEDCDRPGLLGQVVSRDLFGMSQDEACTTVLEAAKLADGGGRAKPVTSPPFPGASRTPPFPPAV